MYLSNRVAIVTGSARGIGRAIALKLAEAGADIVVADISDPSETADEVRNLGRKALAITANVTSAADMKMLAEETVKTFGKIDILVNNAGITRDQIVPLMSEEEWDSVLTVNLKSAYLCTRACLRPMLKQRWGRIINISSVVGVMGNAGQSNYSAAKAGLIGFTKSLSKEVASRNITSNSVAPGFISTIMTDKLTDAQRDELKKQIPLGYIGSPDDVAEAVCFFASEKARYITGQVLNVNGGMI